MPAHPKRRWYQFSLKGLLILLTVLACASAMTRYFVHKWREHGDSAKAIRMRDLILSYGGYWDARGIALTNSRITKQELNVLLKELRAFEQSEMRLEGTAFDDSHVKQLLGHRNLENLSLSNTGITDEGLKELTALKEIVWINLNDDAITDAGLAHLSKLPKLEYIEVRGTKVTEEGLEKLKRTFPTLGVNKYDGP